MKLCLKILLLLTFLNFEPQPVAAQDAQNGETIDAVIEAYPVGEVKLNSVESQKNCSDYQISSAEDFWNWHLCDADPYQRICDSASEELKTRVKKEKSDLEAYSTSYFEMIKQSNAETDPKKKEKINEKIYAISKDKVVNKQVEEAAKHLLKILLETKTISDFTKKRMSEMLSVCAKYPRVDPLEDSASIEHEFSTQTLLPENAGGAPFDEYNFRCYLLVSLPVWKACSNGSTSCQFVLFHELGHLMNSCTFLKQSQKEQDKQQVADTFLKYDRKLTDEEKQKFLLDFKKFGASASELSRIGNDLQTANSCLAVVSEPNSATIKKGIYLKKKYPKEVGMHCGFPQGQDRPSQWAEAEADAWGASGFALWLEQKSKLEDRRRALLEALQQVCVHFSGDGKSADEGSHQSWERRVNRNILRNTEIRRIVGCPLNKEVPVSCAPGKPSYFLIPQ